MKDTDFIIKQGWMMTKLHLAGKDLELFALIYGYTKDGTSWYETNIENIKEWLTSSDRCVQRHLKGLVDSGYVLRKENGRGRKSTILLQASREMLEQMEKGEEFTPIKRVTKATKKGDILTPLTPEKGDKSDTTPYIRIKYKDNKSILLRAHTREGEEEQELYKIFFFRKAADPAAEVSDFYRWNEANRDDWNTLSIKKKYYYATTWKLSHGERGRCAEAWLSTWAKIYDWAMENEPQAVPLLLDPRFGGQIYRDPIDNKTTCELFVSREAYEWCRAHQDEVVNGYLNPMARANRVSTAKWTLIDKN